MTEKLMTSKKSQRVLVSLKHDRRTADVMVPGDHAGSSNRTPYVYHILNRESEQKSVTFHEASFCDSQGRFAPQDVDDTDAEPRRPVVETAATQGNSSPHSAKADKNACKFRTTVCTTVNRPGGCPIRHKCPCAHRKCELRTTQQNIDAGLTTVDAVKKFIKKERAQAAAIVTTATEETGRFVG